MPDKFDNTKPNVILISDFTDTLMLSKTFGPFKVACNLRQAGYEVAVISHAHIFTYEEILGVLKHLISDKTLFVGFNNMFYKSTASTPNATFKGGISYGQREIGAMLPHGKVLNTNLKDYIKSLNPTCKLVLGGPTAHDGILNQHFDYVVMGYADISVVNLADHLLTNKKLEKSHRSLFGMTIVNDAKADGFDFVNTAMEYREYDCILPGETLCLEVSRGCIFKCSFCGYPLNGKKKLDYIKQEELIYDELINNYNKFGVTRYYLLDDTFNDSKEKVEMIYRISKRLPFQLEYWAYVRLDLLTAHPETRDMIFESGLRAAHFGIESFNKKSSSIIGKGMGKERLISTLNQIKNRWGNTVMLNATFIIGLPEDTETTIAEQYDDLFSGCTGLDTWGARELEIENKNSRPDIAVSDFAINPESFGYEILGEIPDKNLLNWKNKDLTYIRCQELAQHYRQLNNGTQKISGLASMQISSLGFDLEFSRNKNVLDFDWHTVDLKKQERSQLYKNMFFRAFDIQLNSFATPGSSDVGLIDA